ncbi:MAG: hypothetical protein RIR66_395 [Actinomycetota bacterium]
MKSYEDFNESFQSGAQLAHLIKSPLTALTLHLDEIIHSTNDQNLIEISQSALSEVSRLRLLIENILDTWRISLNHEVTEIDLTQMVESIVRHWDPRFELQNRQIDFKQTARVYAIGSAEIEQAVIEVLVDNSLNHGAGKTEIKLFMEDSWAVIQISDQGPGISKSIQEKLMTYGATTAGNGIGLAWARDQLNIDGGRLEIYSMNPAIFKIYLRPGNKI